MNQKKVSRDTDSLYTPWLQVGLGFSYMHKDDKIEAYCITTQKWPVWGRGF